MTLPGMMESIKPIDFPSRTLCMGCVPGLIFFDGKLNMDIGKHFKL
jgi:hypothetical protein